jgi:hypothetical protein
MRSAWLLATLAGCAYRASSFDAWGHEFRGVRTSVGCLDLAIEWRAEPVAESVLDYDFGNRCDRPVVVDLLTPTVVGKTAGDDVAMVPYDPLHELLPLPLDGRSLGTEAIEYRTTAATDVHAICVDAAAVASSASPAWLCVARPPPIVARESW